MGSLELELSTLFVGGRLDIGKIARVYKPLNDDSAQMTCDAERIPPSTLLLTDCTVPQFMTIAEYFPTDEYAYAVTPNVDHLIRFCDDSSFRDLYRAAKFILLDSRFLARVLRVTTGVRLPTCPGQRCDRGSIHRFDRRR